MSLTTEIVRGKFDPARVLAYSAITSTFQQISTPFANTLFIFFVQNFTDQNIDFSVSFTGVDLSFTLAPGGTLTSDMFSNGIQLSVGEAVWVRYTSAAPTTGFVQFSAILPAS
jgi:hypothetical protein